ncbi:peptidoglycan DD-metalloendopeptidase family protein [Candidatus Kaiserbacteria bacterium]|nr:peptidoglycan DD-metalloendopeptidase family protein [Candidatus Kaiserbacteria bacterium]
MKVYTVLFTLMAVMLFNPTNIEASHRSGGSGGVDTSSLGSKIVKEFPIPILFGLSIDEVTPDFGDPRGGGTRSHEGQDLIALKGSPIVSPTKAVVTSVGFGESAGNFVYTANPGGETFRYMHLDSIADIKRGTKLNVGDFIGTVGDTGNAKGTTPHLHFEIRKDKSATDPYPRLVDTFTFKEKISFLDDVLNKADDEDEYIDFLIDTYQSELQEALNKNYELPKELEKALAKVNIVSTADLQKQLDELIDSIPKIIASDLKMGDSSAEVTLLQLYLSLRATGPEADALRGAGATGYYGPVTEASVRAYQKTIGVPQTGIFDLVTRRLL